MKLIKYLRTAELSNISRQLLKRPNSFRPSKLQQHIPQHVAYPSTSESSISCTSPALPTFSKSLLRQLKVASGFCPSFFITRQLVQKPSKTTDYALLRKACSNFCPGLNKSESRKLGLVCNPVQRRHFKTLAKNKRSKPITYKTGQKYRRFGSLNEILYKLRLFCRKPAEKMAPHPAPMKMNIVTDKCTPGKTKLEIFPVIEEKQERVTPMKEDIASSEKKRKLICVRKNLIQPTVCEELLKVTPEKHTKQPIAEPEVVCPEPPDTKDPMSVPYYFKKVCVKTENGRCVKYEMQRCPMPDIIRKATCKDKKAPCGDVCLGKLGDTRESIAALIDICSGRSTGIPVCNPCETRVCYPRKTPPSEPEPYQAKTEDIKTEKKHKLHEWISQKPAPIRDPSQPPPKSIPICDLYIKKRVKPPKENDPCKAADSVCELYKAPWKKNDISLPLTPKPSICDPCKSRPRTASICDPCKNKDPCKTTSTASDPCNSRPKTAPVCDPCTPQPKLTRICDSCKIKGTAVPDPCKKEDHCKGDSVSDPCKEKDPCGVTAVVCKPRPKPDPICDPHKRKGPPPTAIGRIQRKTALGKKQDPCKPSPFVCDPCKALSKTEAVCDPCKKKDPCRVTPPTADPSRPKMESVCDPCRKMDPCKPSPSICDPCKSQPKAEAVCDPCKKQDPCRPRPQTAPVCDPCKKRDPCADSSRPTIKPVCDPCKKIDPCKPSPSICDPCKAQPKSEALCDPCKKQDPCKPRPQIAAVCDPCKKKDPCGVAPLTADPSRPKIKPVCDPCKKMDPCKPSPSICDSCKAQPKAEAVCDPCKKQDPCRPRPQTAPVCDPCKKRDPCKKKDPCEASAPKPCVGTPRRPKTASVCKKKDACVSTRSIREPCKRMSPSPCNDPCKKVSPCRPNVPVINASKQKDPSQVYEKKNPCEVSTSISSRLDYPCKLPRLPDPCKSKAKRVRDPCKKTDPCKGATKARKCLVCYPHGENPPKHSISSCKKLEPPTAKETDSSTTKSLAIKRKKLCQLTDGERPCPICYKKKLGSSSSLYECKPRTGSGTSTKSRQKKPQKQCESKGSIKKKKKCEIKDGKRPCPLCHKKGTTSCSSVRRSNAIVEPSRGSRVGRTSSLPLKCTSYKVIVPYRAIYTKSEKAFCKPKLFRLERRFLKCKYCGSDTDHARNSGGSGGNSKSNKFNSSQLCKKRKEMHSSNKVTSANFNSLELIKKVRAQAEEKKAANEQSKKRKRRKPQSSCEESQLCNPKCNSDK